MNFASATRKLSWTEITRKILPHWSIRFPRHNVTHHSSAPIAVLIVMSCVCVSNNRNGIILMGVETSKLGMSITRSFFSSDCNSWRIAAYRSLLILITWMFRWGWNGAVLPSSATWIAHCSSRNRISRPPSWIESNDPVESKDKNSTQTKLRG